MLMWQFLQGEYIIRAFDWRISVSQVDSEVVPSGDLQAITFIASGVDRSMGGGSTSWQTTSSWMNLPRLTIDVLTGSDADQRNAGWVSIPERPCEAGKLPAEKVVLLL